MAGEEGRSAARGVYTHPSGGQTLDLYPTVGHSTRVMNRPGRSSLWRGAVAAALLFASASAARAQEPVLATPDTVAEEPLAIPVVEVPRDSSGRRLNITAYPYLYYTPETKVAFGAGGIATFYTSPDTTLRPSKVALSGYWATTGQYKFSLTPAVYLSANRYMGAATIDFGHYVDRYYGTGRSSPDIGEEAQYTSTGTGIEIEFQIPPPLGLSTRMGMIYDLNHTELKDIQSNPYFLAGGVPGQEGGWVSGLGVIWVIDKRDHTFWPKRGPLYRVEIVAYGKELGSDYSFTRYRLDLRQYFPIGTTQVLALQLYGMSVVGGPPFYELPALGGQQRMRGYYQGRYRDVNFLTGQVEFRTPLFWRVGMVAFAGLGDVSSDLSRIRLAGSKFSGGAGLRFAFVPDKKVNLRVDMGFGEGTSGVYFGLEEAF